MSFLRILLLFLLGMMVRRLYLSFRNAAKARRSRENDQVRNPGHEPTDPGYTDLTEQGIDDADFEEIP